MRYITYEINYGGYYGAEDQYIIEVPDDADEDEIDSLIEEDFEEKIRDNCCWRKVEDDRDGEITEYEDDEDM